MPRVGILALQGAFREHVERVRQLGVDAVEVRRPEQLAGLDGLIIPGGESTTIGKLMVQYGLLAPIRALAQAGAPVWGTCAGMIILAKDIGPSEPPWLGVMDIRVARNAFGRQVASFETDLDVPALGAEPFRGVFIRAPWIETADPDVEVLACLEGGTIVAARQGNLLATAFHPELTDDDRFHRLFLDQIAQPTQGP